MVEACVKIMLRRWLGIKKPMPKGMPKPPIILGCSTITVKAYAKIKAPPKNGLVKPVNWAIKMAVMNIASSTNRAIDPHCIKHKKDVIASFLWADGTMAWYFWGDVLELRLSRIILNF